MLLQRFLVYFIRFNFMGYGESVASGGGWQRKKPLTKAQRKKIMEAFKAVPKIQERNQDIAEIEADLADDLLEHYFQDPHAKNKTDHNDRTGDGQSGTTQKVA